MLNHSYSISALNISCSFESNEPSIDSSKKHLILDMDETLLCSNPKAATLSTTKVSVKAFGKPIFISVAARPGLNTFLTEMKKYYNIHIYTSSCQEYAKPILKELGIDQYLSSVMHRNDCDNVDGKWIKDINCLPYGESDMVLIDDSKLQIDNQPLQSLQIKPFFGDASDNELSKLTPFLVELSKCNDVRSVVANYESYVKNGGKISLENKKEKIEVKEHLPLSKKGSSRSTEESEEEDLGEYQNDLDEQEKDQGICDSKNEFLTNHRFEARSQRDVLRRNKAAVRVAC